MLARKITGSWKSKFLKLASKFPYVDSKVSAKNGIERDHLNFKSRNAVVAGYKNSQKGFSMVDLILAPCPNRLHM